MHPHWPATTPKTLRPAVGLLTLTALMALSSCAHQPADPAARAEFDKTNDPIEPTNRAIFAGNQFVDRNALQPVARGYEKYVPGAARKSIHNFVGNLGQPSVAINDVLQGNVGRAWNTTQRFAINTVVGGAGLFDVATDWHRPGHQADFGQTLGVWGVGPGPAVQIPLLGPSNLRDTVGMVVGTATNPATYITTPAVQVVKAVSGGLGAVDGRATMLGATDALEHQSLDYYATLRSVTAQRRANLIADGKTGLVQNSVPPASSGPGGLVVTAPGP